MNNARVHCFRFRRCLQPIDEPNSLMITMQANTVAAPRSPCLKVNEGGPLVGRRRRGGGQQRVSPFIERVRAERSPKMGCPSSDGRAYSGHSKYNVSQPSPHTPDPDTPKESRRISREYDPPGDSVALWRSENKNHFPHPPRGGTSAGRTRASGTGRRGTVVCVPPFNGGTALEPTCSQNHT